MSNINEQHVIENTVFTVVNAFTAMNAAISDESGRMAFRVAGGRRNAIAVLLSAAANETDGSGKPPSDELLSFSQRKIAEYVIDALEQHTKTPAKDNEKGVSGSSSLIA